MKKIVCLFACLFAGSVNAAIISSSDYSLTSITGSYAWGQTDWNDEGDSGYVNNAADISTVGALMSDGYSDSTRNTGPINGIYNYPTGYAALTFGFTGGSDYILDSLSFISSRSYDSTTVINIDYLLDGGSWINALSTTAGALGITTGFFGNTYSMNFGSVQADTFRFSTNGGQVSLHEISISGAAVTSVPEPTSLALLGLGLAGIGFSRKKTTV